MRINLTAALAEKMGIQPGDQRVTFHGDGGGCFFDAHERTAGAPAPRPSYTPPAPRGPGKLAVSLAAWFQTTGEARDQAEGLALAAARFDQV